MCVSVNTDGAVQNVIHLNDQVKFKVKEYYRRWKYEL